MKFREVRVIIYAVSLIVAFHVTVRNTCDWMEFSLKKKIHRDIRLLNVIISNLSRNLKNYYKNEIPSNRTKFKFRMERAGKYLYSDDLPRTSRLNNNKKKKKKRELKNEKDYYEKAVNTKFDI